MSRCTEFACDCLNFDFIHFQMFLYGFVFALILPEFMKCKKLTVYECVCDRRI